MSTNTTHRPGERARAAAAKLQTEIIAIQRRLEDARTRLRHAEFKRSALAEAQQAAGPTIGPAELETARLSDLAGLTQGAEDALRQQLQAAQAQTAQARQDAPQLDEELQRAHAAVQFHARSLEEAQRLELAALSEAARADLPGAQLAYVHAAQHLRDALSRLVAVQAAASLSERARRYADEHGTWDAELPPQWPGLGLTLPAAEVLDSDLSTQGEPVRGSVTVTGSLIDAIAAQRLAAWLAEARPTLAA